MFENVLNFFKRIGKKDQIEEKSKDTAKERLHLVLMQDRANVSADFLDMMRQEIIEVIKKYIDVDESEIDVRLTNKTNEDGTVGAPALYANIPISGIKEEMKKDNSNKEKKAVTENKEEISIDKEESSEIDEKDKEEIEEVEEKVEEVVEPNKEEPEINESEEEKKETSEDLDKSEKIEENAESDTEKKDEKNEPVTQQKKN